MNYLPNIDPSVEEKKITSFIKTVLKEQGFKNVLIGMSGGIDSATSFSLLEKSISPQNIFVTHLYYFKSQIDLIEPMLNKANIPKKNIYEISIASAVKAFENMLGFKDQDLAPLRQGPAPSGAGQGPAPSGAGQGPAPSGAGQGFGGARRIRLGNIMARVRMTTLYDLAKKHSALVCGTENKSEFYLGYFTLFGDEASDFEPIQHLYKTQVYQLAKHLDIPQNIINQAPTAGLWTGQTDEDDFGFSYKEADSVLYLYFEQKNSLSEIISKGFPNAEKIIDWTRKNSFKHHLPYVVK